MSEPEQLRSPGRMSLAAVMLVAIVLRAAVMAMGTGQFDDPDNYLPLARSLAAGQGLSLRGHPTAYRPPFYPILLAPLVAIAGDDATTGLAVLHVALGAATAGLAALTAHRWGLGRARAVAAGLIVAADPVLLWQSRYVMTETPTAFLVSASLAALTLQGRAGPVVGGVMFGLAALTRPSMLPGAVLTVLAGLAIGQASWSRRLTDGLTMTLSMLAVLAPWAIRNAAVFGIPIVTTTHGGYTLALANNEVYYRDVLNGPPGRVWTGHDQWLWWDSVNRETAGMSEPDADRFMRRRALKLAIDRPADFLHASVRRLERFWSVSPALAVYSPSVRLLAAVWTIPLWVALLMGLFRRGLWTWPQVAAPLSILGLMAVHSLYWTDMRMRAPIVPAIALVAAGALFTGRNLRSGMPDAASSGSPGSSDLRTSPR
jgi:4-amino-4-deoxy-L-arabinose transferase-like glycosyltransferase